MCVMYARDIMVLSSFCSINNCVFECMISIVIVNFILNKIMTLLLVT